MNDYYISADLDPIDKQALAQTYNIIKAFYEQLDKIQSSKLYSLDTPYQQYSKSDLTTTCELIEELIDGNKFQSELVEWR